MKSLGFGLERIGILVLGAPLLTTSALVASILTALAILPGLNFDGSVLGIIDRTSPAYANYDRQVTYFRDTSKDVAAIFTGSTLLTASGLDALREIHLEIALSDEVDEVLSVFSLGTFSKSASIFETFLPDSFADDAHAASAIAQLVAQTPSALSLIAPSKDAALVIVSLDVPDDISEVQLGSILRGLRSEIDRLTPPGIDVILAGLPSIWVSLVAAILSDQAILTLAGALIGLAISYFIFGTFRSAVVCTLPGIIAVLWLLASFALLGEKLNFMTTVLPTLALIIAFADSVVLYFHWQKLNAEQNDQLANLKRAILRVGPASALTSITTAMAFLSFSYASGELMKAFAWFGVAAVFLAFIAVITSLPAACYWVTRLGGVRTARLSPLGRLGGLLSGPAKVRPAIPVVSGLVLLGLLFLAHFQLKPSYTLANQLPMNSEIRRAVNFMNSTFGATMQIFVLIPVAPNSTFADPRNRQRITEIDRVLSDRFGPGSVISLGRIWEQSDPANVADIAAQISDLKPSLRGRFLSSDGRTMQVIVTVLGGQDTRLDASTARTIRTTLQKVGPTDDLVITGMRILVAEEFPNLIGQLRTGLLIAVLLGVAMVILATRNWRLGIAALVPNLLPILITEWVILISDGRLNIASVMALTIAFGMSIDCAVHIINSYKAELGQGKMEDRAIGDAVREIGPALFASTLILCAATVITQFSSLPSMIELGRLLVVTLVVALASNLILLPGFVRLLGRQNV